MTCAAFPCPESRKCTRRAWCGGVLHSRRSSGQQYRHGCFRVVYASSCEPKIFSIAGVNYLNFLGVLGVECLNSFVMGAIKYLNLVSKFFVLYLDFVAQIKLALLESLVETSHFRVVS